MSKSLNNFIRPEEVFLTNGADALRQWGAMGGSPGNDIMFQWKEITAASRFQQKLWSIFRFSLPLIAGAEPLSAVKPGQVDRWLLGELDSLVKRATAAMDAFQFDETMKAIRGFAWETLADNYIELVKARLYGADGPEKRAAKATLYRAIQTVSLLLAPFTPFISEEIYHSLTAGESVHTQSWPEPLGIEIDPAGLAIKEIAAALRRYKAERSMALNAPLPGITVYSGMALETVDLAGVANSPVESCTESPQIEMKPVAVKPQMKIIGPLFKDKSGRIIKTLSGMDPAAVAGLKASGFIHVEVDGEGFDLPATAAEIVVETLSAGAAVDVLRLEGAVVLIKR